MPMVNAEDDRIDALLNDPQRLQALRSTGYLDSAPVPALDAMALEASERLGVPSAFISLLDVGRDFYLAQAGFDGPLRDSRQLEGRTFCHLTLPRGEAVVIGDTHLEPAHRRIPTTSTLGVRAYLGIPLMMHGQIVGSFCAIDTVPRQWREADLDLMLELAERTMQHLQRTR